MLVDPKGSNYSKYKGAYLLTPNKKEAAEATRINIKDNESLNEAIIKLKNECDLDISLITLSNQGVAIYDNKLRIHPTLAREVFDVTGAGDTVLATLGFALACGHEIDYAVTFFTFRSLVSLICSCFVLITGLSLICFGSERVCGVSTFGITDSNLGSNGFIFFNPENTPKADLGQLATLGPLL